MLLIGVSNAQSLERSVIGSAGGFSSSGNVQISWTAGETVVNTASAGSVILTQGFQQPEQKSNHVVSVDLNQVIAVYPNPSNGIFNVAFNTEMPGNSSFTTELFDGAGKLALRYEKIDLNAGPARIDISSLPAGLYTLRLINTEQESATFRLTVIK